MVRSRDRRSASTSFAARPSAACRAASSAASALRARCAALSSAPARSSAEAWQNAVRELLQQPEYRQPFYWAGFKLIGNTVN